MADSIALLILQRRVNCEGDIGLCAFKMDVDYVVINLYVGPFRAGELHKAFDLGVYGIAAQDNLNPAGLQAGLGNPEGLSVVLLFRFLFRLRDALHCDTEVELLRRALHHLSEGKAHVVVLAHRELFRRVGYCAGTGPVHRALRFGACGEKALHRHLDGIFREVYPNHGVFCDNAAGVCLDVRRKVLCAGLCALIAAVTAACQCHKKRC